MQKEKKKKPRKQTRYDVLAGLRAGFSYHRPYSFEAGRYQGVESLVPVGRGPVFTRVRHTCVITGDGGSKTNSADEELDDDFVLVIENGLRWARF